VKTAFLPKIFNLRPELNSSQRAERARVRSIVQGNAKPSTHAADASHLSEAAETGCCYFITSDKRILKKRTELHSALPPTLNIVTMPEFIQVFDDFEAGRRL
jgi:predicted nucleic acid-binding protein